MNIILTCLINFQEYILINIDQLIKLGHKNIYVITNNNLIPHFEEFKKHINIINADEFVDSYNFNSKSLLDDKFRCGFWKLTSQRFFVIYEFMLKYNITNVIHLENDVLIYYNCNQLENYINKNYMYIPFDTYTRNIASIVYIPDANLFKKILDKYNFNMNDMENFASISKETGLIQKFPIFNKEYIDNDEQLFVSSNSDKIPFIFDAAAIGQYLGGVDPRNISGNTEGFINETCVIKYNKYKILFKNCDGLKKPFIVINGNEYAI